MDLKQFIRDVPDFPKPGIVFKDITPLLGNYVAFNAMLDAFVAKYAAANIKYVCGIESRGFIIGAPLALRLNAGFVPIRKAGKLPCKKISREYSLEYGSDAIEMHADAVAPGDRVLLVDDLIATGGTALAAVELLQAVGSEIVGVAFVVELKDLQGARKFEPQKYFSLLAY